MMTDVLSPTATIKAGVMLSSGGLLADLVIFSDQAYLVLAIAGSIVSMFGVLHEVLKNRPIEHTVPQIIVEIIKGLSLGVLAIPFWYLLLSEAGGAFVEKIFEIKINNISNSVWLMISFAMSWYTVPIFNWIVLKVIRRSKDV